jgi:hypothetical protein
MAHQLSALPRVSAQSQTWQRDERATVRHEPPCPGRPRPRPSLRLRCKCSSLCRTAGVTATAEQQTPHRAPMCAPRPRPPWKEMERPSLRKCPSISVSLRLWVSGSHRRSGAPSLAVGTGTHTSVSLREGPRTRRLFLCSEWAQLHSTATVAVNRSRSTWFSLALFDTAVILFLFDNNCLNID